MTIADLHRAVQSTLASKRLGTLVFVRYLLHSADKAVVPRLAQMTGAVRDWLGQPIERLYALGSPKQGQVSLMLEGRGGATAQIAWTASARAGVDLTVVGNHGALYHDAGTAAIADDTLIPLADKPDADLVAWIERALRSSRPETDKPK